MWRVPLRWYLAAAAPLVLAVGVAAVVSLGPSRVPTVADWFQMEGFPAAGMVGSFALVLVVNAYGEETGWRGFALPRFRRRHDRLQASLLVSVPWMLWHLPTFFLDTGYRGFNPMLLPGFALGIFAGAVVLTWLYEGAGCSILLVALWHAFLNLGSATKAGEGTVQVSVTMLVLLWSLLIARSWRRAAGAADGPSERPEQQSAT
jgi:membrane protease YdiL (CAAX protease family)